MLPSPPLTVDSGASSPRSLKRAFSNAIYDATPPLSQPLKRRRCSTSEPVAALSEPPDESLDVFDPSGLVSPPEYTHTLYDPEFGAKVCQQYRRSLKTRHACDAVVSAARIHKYGQEDALAYSPGSTPDHIRSSYEAKQRLMDELAEEIIANSDSEADSDAEAFDVKDWRIEKRVALKTTSEFQLRTSDVHDQKDQSSRDLASADHVKRSFRMAMKETSVPFALRRNDVDEVTRYDGVHLLSKGRAVTTAQCNIYARSGFAYKSQQRTRRAREAFIGGIRIAAS